MNIVRKAGIGLLAGLMGGLAWGIGARIAMRVVAIEAHKSTEFSLEGTIMILVMGAVYSLPLGLAFAGMRRFLPGSWGRAGLLFGLLALLILGLPFYLGPLSDEAGIGNRALAVGMFGALFVGFGMVVALAYAWLDRHLGMRYNGVKVIISPAALWAKGEPDGPRSG